MTAAQDELAGPSMTLYYQDAFASVFHGDCRDFDLWHLADVLVTDPPYGIDYHTSQPRTEGNPRFIEGDKDTSLRDWVLDVWGDDRPAIVFGSWKVSRPAATKALLVWDTKGALGMGDLSIPWKPSHQEMYVLGSGFMGRRTSDVLSFPPVQATARLGRVHPHEKPVRLMQELLGKCPPGIIIDPFMGSGSTLCAATNLARTSIGIEKDERYCEIAAQRLQGRRPLKHPEQEGLAI